MKHLRKFESWDLGHRFSEEEENKENQQLCSGCEQEECSCESKDDETPEYLGKIEDDSDSECEPCETEGEESNRVWGDEEDSSLSGSSIKSFDDFGNRDKEDEFVLPLELEGDHSLTQELYPEGEDEEEGDENLYIESFKAFNEKKAVKSKKDDEEEDEKSTKGKTPKTKKEKELAAKYPPKNKITKGDFIAAAIENKKGNKKEEDKKDDKKPKFGSKEWHEKYGNKKK